MYTLPGSTFDISGNPPNDNPTFNSFARLQYFSIDGNVFFASLNSSATSIDFVFASPIKWKHSGRQINFDPSFAASLIKLEQISKLRFLSVVAVNCTHATFNFPLATILAIIYSCIYIFLWSFARLLHYYDFLFGYNTMMMGNTK